MSNPNAAAIPAAKSRLVLRTWVSLSLLTAMTYITMYVSKLLPQLYGFLQLEIKGTVIAIGGFIFGPLSAAILSIVVAVVEMFTVSDTGPYGCIMNIVAACAFACPAAFVYQRFHTKKGAVAGLTLSVFTTVVVMVLWNYLITPLYMTNMTREQIAPMLLTVFFPFNLIKGVLNMVLTLILYKPVVTALRKSRLIPESGEMSTGKSLLGVLLFASFLLATTVLVILVIMRIL